MLLLPLMTPPLYLPRIHDLRNDNGEEGGQRSEMAGVLRLLERNTMIMTTLRRI